MFGLRAWHNKILIYQIILKSSKVSKIKIYKNQTIPKSYWTNEKHHFQVGLCTEEYRQLPGHTLCMPDRPNVSKQGMTEVDKQAVLDQHNRLRGGVNPPATDLVKLVSIRSAYALYKKGLFKNLNNYFFSRTRFFLFLFYRELHFCHILFRKKKSQEVIGLHITDTNMGDYKKNVLKN